METLIENKAMKRTVRWKQFIGKKKGRTISFAKIGMRCHTSVIFVAITLTAGLQKVSAQPEMLKPVPQTVANNE
jgi:hypothetical protein